MLEGGGIYYPVKTQFFWRVFFSVTPCLRVSLGKKSNMHLWCDFLPVDAGGCCWQVGTFSRRGRRSTALEDVVIHWRCGSNRWQVLFLKRSGIPQKIWWTVGFCHQFFASFWGMDGIRHIWSRWLVDIHNRHVPRHFSGFITILVG